MKQIDKTSKVGFAIHSFGPIDPSIYFNHMGCMMSFASKFNMVFLGIDKQRTAEGRNVLVNSAKNMNCTHILFVDADHHIPIHTLDALCKNDKALIASGLVTKRKSPYGQVGFVLEDKNYHPVNLPIDGRCYLVDIPAMGCTLIEMSVFDKLEEPYFTDSLEITEAGKSYNKRSDINFFEKCGKVGIKMVIDTRVLVGHMRDAVPVYPNCVPDIVELNRSNKIWSSFDALERQAKVYKIASDYALETDNVLDLGCGNPIKLCKYLKFGTSITGVDFPEKILDIATEGNKLNNGAAKNWVGKNLNEEFDLGWKANLVISSDVIEHLKDPNVLIKTAKNHMTEDSIFIVSSPEKTTTAQDNPLHVKEFTKEELSGILLANDLVIIDHIDYQEITVVPYINNVFVCKLSKE